MGADLFAIDRLLGFLLVLARVSGLFVFVPLPGLNAAPVTARIVLSLSITVCLLPIWPAAAGLDQSVARLAGYAVMDAAVGMALGLTVAFAIEAMKVAAQAAGLQAGFGYASTIDPGSEADSSLLLVIAELFAGLLFFAAGLDRQVLAILAGTLKTLPPGQIVQLHGAPEVLARLGGELFAYGLRLAFPVIAFLVLVDLTLGFLGRVNAQLQLLTLAFPVKIIAALGLFAMLAPVYSRVYIAFAQHALDTAGRILLRR
jgi:flagellar biosynthetic protein FliR